MTKLKAFPYFGGKLSHLNFILEHLPYTERYIEPFGGSAAVLLNRETSPVETYNDLDGEVVNFFRVLREHPDELVRQLERTPYSREEFTQACRSDGEDDIEKARQFFVRLSQGYNSKTSRSNPSDWSYATGCSRRGMSKEVSMVKGYQDALDDVAARLSRVQIENRPATTVIEAHDHEEALFYCDPPYSPDTRSDRWDSEAYACDMTEQDHRELSRTLHQCDAKVAISAYDSDLMRELYAGWTVTTAEEKVLGSSGYGSTESEMLITNYKPEERSAVVSPKQTTLSSVDKT